MAEAETQREDYPHFLTITARWMDNDPQPIPAPIRAALTRLVPAR